MALNQVTLRICPCGWQVEVHDKDMVSSGPSMQDPWARVATPAIPDPMSWLRSSTTFAYESPSGVLDAACVEHLTECAVAIAAFLDATDGLPFMQEIRTPAFWLHQYSHDTSTVRPLWHGDPGSVTFNTSSFII